MGAYGYWCGKRPTAQCQMKTIRPHLHKISIFCPARSRKISRGYFWIRGYEHCLLFFFSFLLTLTHYNFFYFYQEDYFPGWTFALFFLWWFASRAVFDDPFASLEVDFTAAPQPGGKPCTWPRGGEQIRTWWKYHPMYFPAKVSIMRMAMTHAVLLPFQWIHHDWAKEVLHATSLLRSWAQRLRA